jgi:hypothetical protein
LAIIWVRAMFGTEKAPAADGQRQGFNPTLTIEAPLPI